MSAGPAKPDSAAWSGSSWRRVRRRSARESERQRRANRRLRAALAGVLALLALAAAAGLVALRERGHARDEATTAIAQRLGAQALIQPSLDRSLLLAREAVRLDESVSTEGNLLAALLRSPAALGMAHATGNRALDEALSPDGRTLAVRGDDGAVTFFDTRTLRPGRRVVRERRADRPDGRDRRPTSRARLQPATVAGWRWGVRMAVWRCWISSTSTVTWARRSGETGRSMRRTSPTRRMGRPSRVGEPVNGRFTPPAALIELHDAQTNAPRRSSALLPGGRLLGYTSDGRSLLVA